MYTKDETSKLKQAFWTAFGQYIAPQLSAEGQKINWINYRTGIRYLSFKMQADNRSAFIAIELSHPDAGMRDLLFEQFTAFRTLLSTSLNEEWEWQPELTDENFKQVSRIVKSLDHVSIFKQSDWPALISFFKPRIIALDEFWNDARDSFELFS
ncbi:DUF4268 domain-containing protein [Pedobacter sp. L105]|uniref:DUF4268 domain-containing protein n=1 Tax=Pedobacter sp. L105 TaxID=1641871 RepID=UPI00131AF52E|nr:DUF4268 domain-containing protein [Pedobacter sp. L105]